MIFTMIEGIDDRIYSSYRRVLGESVGLSDIY